MDYKKLFESENRYDLPIHTFVHKDITYCFFLVTDISFEQKSESAIPLFYSAPLYFAKGIQEHVQKYEIPLSLLAGTIAQDCTDKSAWCRGFVLTKVNEQLAHIFITCTFSGEISHLQVAITLEDVRKKVKIDDKELKDLQRLLESMEDLELNNQKSIIIPNVLFDLDSSEDYISSLFGKLVRISSVISRINRVSSPDITDDGQVFDLEICVEPEYYHFW